MYFVYRTHYEGPLSKRVRRLTDTSVVGWFQRGWERDDAEEWAEAQLGGDVYGLDSIFDAARKHRLPVPQTWQELRDQLHKHLYVEGDADYIRVDEHMLRVRTDDDEVELAYFFLDDQAVESSADRLAYLIHPGWPLPAETGGAGEFIPAVPTQQATPGGTSEGATYVVLLTYYDGASLPGARPQVLPGVRLSGVAAHLRAAAADPDEAAAAWRAEWPPELRVLAALIEPHEDSIAPALARCNEWPGFNLNEWPWLDLPDDGDSLAAQRAALPPLAADRHPDRSLLEVDEHLAQLAMHGSDDFGYQQWFIFDDIWASSHPDVAQSLLRYASHWDPYA